MLIDLETQNEGYNECELSEEAKVDLEGKLISALEETDIFKKKKNKNKRIYKSSM